jgi:diguanylate cyclase (GGDEF)-like protein/putative nucleotidyltransferase with HDIG domain
MKTKAGGGGARSRRWQDIRAHAIDRNFDADRRRVGERVAVSFRWLFLIVLAALNNFTALTTNEARLTVDLLLVGWAIMNVIVNVLLARGYQPGRQFSLTTMCLDIFFATGLVYLSNGFASPFFLALFLAVITNAVRFGATASVASALVISFIYLFIGGSFTPANFISDPKATIGQVFLFLVVALATGYMTRELDRERRHAMERAAQADALRELSMTMVTDTDIKDVFRVVTDQALEMTSANRGRMILASADGFDIVASSDRAEAAQAEPEPLNEEQLAHVARTGEAAFAADKRFLVIPIASGNGVTALLNLSRIEGVFTNQDIFTVAALSGSSAVPLANALRYQRSNQEASTDGLTGLYNVREFRRRLEAAFARPDRGVRPLSIILVDFDHFKSVNDEIGHQHGDHVLQAGVKIVRACSRTNDVVARYGGDELVIMVADANAAGAWRLADRIIEATRAASLPTTPGHHLTFSIGVASYPEDALTPVELVSAADQALYHAKREGKDRFSTFTQLVSELQGDDDRLVAKLVAAGAQVVVAVAHAVDNRSAITRGHSSRVAAIADAISKHSNFPQNHLENLRTAAFLHDVGHVRLDVDSLGFELPGHAEEGERIVTKAKFPSEVAESVRHHHERWDGDGMPDRLVGEKIPLGARILAVSEAYEAMTAGRGCTRLAPPSALERVTDGSGSEFDPAIVEALRRCVQDGSLDFATPEEALPASA